MSFLSALAPYASAAVSGGLSYLGQNQTNAQNSQLTYAGYANSNIQQLQAQQYNDAEARINREWQEQMSNTAYQRATSSLRSAGLNPILAMGGVPPASTPGGSTASSSTAGGPGALRMENALGAGVSSAVQAGRVAADVQQARSTVDLQGAAKEKTNAEKALTDVQTGTAKLQQQAQEETTRVTRDYAGPEKLASIQNVAASAKEANSRAALNDATTNKMLQFGGDSIYSPSTYWRMGSAAGDALGGVTRRAIGALSESPWSGTNPNTTAPPSLPKPPPPKSTGADIYLLRKAGSLPNPLSH
ncbi:MAG: DNA pilot protein [Microvirus sp.]|nr:MAG: DNA pilot protein [Microvirus sp.]